MGYVLCVVGVLGVGMGVFLWGMGVRLRWVVGVLGVGVVLCGVGVWVL